MEPATYTLAEAAELLGIGESSAYRLAAQNEFPVPVLCIGRTKRVSRVALMKFIDGDIEQAS